MAVVSIDCVKSSGMSQSLRKYLEEVLMRNFWLMIPLACVLIGCGKRQGGGGDKQFEAESVEEDGARAGSEFSYVEQPSSSLGISPSKLSPAENSRELKARKTLSSGLEVCSELPLQRCISCCEDFFTAGTQNWDQCVTVCADQTVDLPKEY